MSNFIYRVIGIDQKEGMNLITQYKIINILSGKEFEKDRLGMFKYLAIHKG